MSRYADDTPYSTSIRIGNQLARDLDTLAKADDRSRNNYITRVLEAHCEPLMQNAGETVTEGD